MDTSNVKTVRKGKEVGDANDYRLKSVALTRQKKRKTTSKKTVRPISRIPKSQRLRVMYFDSDWVKRIFSLQEAEIMPIDKIMAPAT